MPPNGGGRTAENVAGYPFSHFSFYPACRFTAIVISAIGAAKKNFWLVINGAILFIPNAHYLNGAHSNRFGSGTTSKKQDLGMALAGTTIPCRFIDSGCCAVLSVSASVK
jgi:hypothetical protein